MYCFLIESATIYLCDILYDKFSFKFIFILNITQNNCVDSRYIFPTTGFAV